MEKKHLILAIDDDSSIVDDLEDTIRSMGHRCLKAQSSEDGWNVLQRYRPCLVLLDLELKTDRRSAKAKIAVGFNLLSRIRTKFDRGDLRVIVITAHSGDSNDLPIRALRGQADDFVKKPFADGTLERQIHFLLGQCVKHPGETSDGAAVKYSSAAKGAKATRNIDAKTKDTIHFDGRPKKRRYCVVVNQKELWVRATTFEVLWRLALPLWAGKSAWLKTTQLQMAGNIHQTVKRAREDIRAAVKNPDLTLETNTHQYRLSTTPAHLTRDDALVAEYFSHLFELLKKKRP
jgi:DNA-binding response OmpR family regulator